MRPLNNLDYHYLATELQGQLRGAYLNNIYQTGENRFRFKFKAKTELNLLVAPGQYAYTTDTVPESQELGPFVRLLRDHVENARVGAVRQVGFDRVLAFDLEKVKKFSLVFEMFGDGNILLCDAEGKIVDAAERVAHGSRVLAPGKTYALPPNAKKSPSEITVDILTGLSGKIVSVLSKHVNVAPFYLEEACHRASVALSRTAESLTREERNHLVDELAALADQPLQPVVYYSGTEAVDFAPFPLGKIQAESAQPFPSFSQALAAYFASAKAPVPEDGQLKGLRHTLMGQQEALVALDEEERTLRAKGDGILMHYSQVAEALEKAKAGKVKTLDVKLSE